MYRKADNNLNFVQREEEVEKFWEEEDIFRKSMENRKGCETYTFYDGPPTANGKPHIGHVLTRVIKDMIPRYQTMKGRYVPRKAGWDTHGLPVELEVEREIGINGKEQIEEYGIEPFVKKCKESVWKYKSMWEDFSGKVGFWADMEHPYVTYDDDYIESEWWALSEIFKQGLLYKGFKIVPYCPRCGTPLSSAEVSQGYKTIKERSAIVRFAVAGEDAYFLAWTTTPWTLPSNVALCVNPDEIYCKVLAADGYTYYLAQALLSTVLKGLGKADEPAYEVLESFTGKELEYKEYEPLFACTGDFVKGQEKKGFYITCDSYVTMSDGTGIVHIAPAFGEDDAHVGSVYDLPFVQFVNSRGEMTEETPYAGMFVKAADPQILSDLQEAGKLFDAPEFTHEYPHCWRCDSPLIYYARDSWYIKETAVRDELVKNNNTVNWIPQSIGRGRFGNWLENIQDWAISRNRYWGTPLPIWECACGHRECIKSRAQLAERSGNPADAQVELHRPYIDQVTFSCPKCGGVMRRVPEVIDCWFDSGAMPFAQHHYPFENQELFKQQFPAQFISEAVDQTRGWFHSLMAVSTLLFHRSPYENVIVLGHVQDENGQKMSKSKGNAVDPFDALRTYGADAIRWYFYTNSAPWLPNRFNGKAVLEGQRKFMGTLWNTYAFFVLYADIDEFDATKYTLDYDRLCVMDRWLLSRLSSAVKETDKRLGSYQIPEAARALDDFVDDMSNWYVRRCRGRFWAKGMEEDKIDAYLVLYTALTTICLAAAPMIPFMTEEIYQNLVRSINDSAPESIHLCDYPAVREKWIDPDLERQMAEARKIVVTGRACRNTANIKNRQPIGRMFVKAPQTPDPYFTEIIADELNVKEVIFTDDVSAYSTYTIKPQYSVLGPKYGKRMKQIASALSQTDGNAAMAELSRCGVLKLDSEEGDVILKPSDLVISVSQAQGFVSEGDNTLTVVVDTHLTPELIEEGFVRELVSKIQTMRREADFEVTDHIVLSYEAGGTIQKIFEKYAYAIAAEVLAEKVQKGSLDGYEKEWDINGKPVTLAVRRSQAPNE